MRPTRLINIYIAKGFAIKFLQIITAFSLLIFFVNFLDISDGINRVNMPFYDAILAALFQVPEFLNDVVTSLVLIAAIVTFFTFSSKSEINIMRASGMSLWKILLPIALAAFALGIFWIMVFNPLSIKMIKESDAINRKYFEQETREVLAPAGGIWLKQENIENKNEELLIKAKELVKENIEFKDVNIWFFNEKNEFYKKIDAKIMILDKAQWRLKDITYNDKNNINKKIDNLVIPTDLDGDFIVKKVVNNFQNAKRFSFFELPNLIREMRVSGFSSTKFSVHFNSLLITPLLFVSMVLIACFFGLNHIRDNNSIIMIFLGVILGLVLYITSNVIITFGSSGILSVFASTWVVAFICLSLGILLIYKKENL
jgi:lipopolysaccharide export system permease protein